MLRTILILPLVLVFASLAAAQENSLEKIVLHRFPGNEEKFVVYVVPSTHEIRREECFYSNGQMEFTGSYLGGIENGPWKFYWPNGMLKSDEFYLNGREHGEARYFDNRGKIIRFCIYNEGVVVNETTY